MVIENSKFQLIKAFEFDNLQMLLMAQLKLRYLFKTIKDHLTKGLLMMPVFIDLKKIFVTQSKVGIMCDSMIFLGEDRLPSWLQGSEFIDGSFYNGKIITPDMMEDIISSAMVL